MRLTCFEVAIWCCAAAALPSQARGDDVEAATAFFRDKDRTAWISSAQAVYATRPISGEGHESRFQVGATHKALSYLNPKSIVVEKQLNGQTRANEDAVSLAYDQGLRV